jgi:hypothetical protein
MWEPILAQMNPNKVALLEDAWSLVLVDHGGMAIDMVFYCLSCVVMQVLHDVGSLGDVHVDALVKRVMRGNLLGVARSSRIHKICGRE